MSREDRSREDDGRYSKEIPNSEILRVIASTDGVTTRGIAATLDYSESGIYHRLRELHTHEEIEKNSSGEWILSEVEGPDDPYIF